MIQKLISPRLNLVLTEPLPPTRAPNHKGGGHLTIFRDIAISAPFCYPKETKNDIPETYGDI